MTLASDARAIARAAVRSVEPVRAVRAHLAVRRGRVLLDGAPWVDAKRGSVHLVALGKAAGPMLDAASRVLGDARGSAVAAVGSGYPRPTVPATVAVGEHPVPGLGSVRAGRLLLERVRRLSPGAPLLFLISGGGSAIADAPAEGLGVVEIRATTQALLASGAPIGAANVVRRHLSALKGGGLALAAGDRPKATLAISDVVHDPPWDIAGGPTVPDPTTFRDALAVVQRYRLAGRLPAPALRRLQEGARGRLPETWKPVGRRPRLTGFHIIGSNVLAQEAAVAAARARGYATHRIPDPVVGEARVAGYRLARELGAWARATRRRSAWISGGETTVTLGPHPGRGGRNEEMALAAVPLLEGLDNAVLLCVATDGVDGRSWAAGALVDGRTAARARRKGVRIPEVLRWHDSDRALAAVGARYLTGPTGTNVSDLQIRLARPIRTGSRARPRGSSPRRRRRSSAAGSP